MGTLHKDRCTTAIVPRSILLRIFHTNVVGKKQKRHILPSLTFFPRKSCCLRDNVENDSTATQVIDDNKIKRMRTACWVTKTTDTHSEYVILIPFPRQQWFRERASILRCTHIAYLVHC